jgi:general stress protein 26
MVSVGDVESWFGFQQVVYLATAEGDQPRVRPVSLIRLGERFYVVTGARGGVDAGKLRQIRANPRVEYYLPLERDGSSGFIRAEGTASVVDDPATRGRLHREVGWARDYFPSVDHPDYVLLEIRHSCYGFREPGTTEIVRVKV